MTLMLKIAWRNIWRNPRRSFVMIAAISIGLWAGLFVSGLMIGMMHIRFVTSIEQHVSHIQIHHPDFLIDNNLVHAIKDWETLREQLQINSNVKAFTGRAISNGMLSTATQTRGITIMAIDPATEAKTTGLDKNILEGNYLEEGTKNQLLIGRSLAEKLKLQIGSRLVVTFQNTEGDLVSSAFRVGGIFQTANLVLDEKNIYILQSCLAGYTGQQNLVNEVAVLLNDPEQVNSESEVLQASFPGLKVRTWADLSPELAYIQDMGGQMLIMIMAIILLALAFGLVNTMLMSVHERVYELGMLMAIGMNRRKVFLMITLETTFLTFVGSLAGMALGYITTLILGQRGLDLAPVGGDAMLQYGYPSVVYPMLEPIFFIQLTFLVVIMVFASAIFPTIKALKLKPAVAVRND
ncbi:MAG TPA: FtsX-like permease family protein [Bacteroidales bacterium]|nr:FtsX-like permease family protein [Bacteroidales bacterium]